MNLPVRSVDVALVLLSLTLSVVPIQVELDPANNPLPPQVAFKVGEFLSELSPFLPPLPRDIWQKKRVRFIHKFTLKQRGAGNTMLGTI